MTRPDIDPTQLVSGIEAWDALVRDMLSAIAVTPFPVPSYADLASFPAASSYDWCLAVAEDTEKLYFSKGGAWVEVSVP